MSVALSFVVTQAVISQPLTSTERHGPSGICRNRGRWSSLNHENILAIRGEAPLADAMMAGDR